MSARVPPLLGAALDSSPIIAVIGPTAVGKTSIAVELAHSHNAEIVSVDSRQVYRETTIGTAKPTPAELKLVRHHFIDERSIDDPVTAADFASLAASRIEEIRARGMKVVLAGGSTLYVHALLFGLDDVPPADSEIRAELTEILESDGLDPLVDQLKHVDPDTAATIDLANPRRVLRALEVYRTSGKPMSAFKGSETSNFARRTSRFEPTFVLHQPRNVLYDRIDRRVDAMYQAGLVDEVKAILEVGHSPDLQALQTIGYRETIQCLRGEISDERMIELVKRNTRRYAKRQLTWFRRYREFRWIELDDSTTMSA